MTRLTTKRFFAFLSLCSLTAFSQAYAAGGHIEYKDMNWSFDGAFGKVDQASAQRGLQVYKEVCASCHGIKRIAFRNLEEIGFTEPEIKALAKEYTFTDGPDDAGDMFERPGMPSDRFPSPYPNEKAARAANGGAYPPDLSLIVKSRMNGPDYIYSLLTGYTEPHGDVHVPPGLYYNAYFPNHKIAMPPPLTEGLVEYGDNTVASVDQMAQDIVNFLQWAAEPEMEQRKEMGIRAVLFLFMLTIFFIIAKKHVWQRVK